MLKERPAAPVVAMPAMSGTKSGTSGGPKHPDGRRREGGKVEAFDVWLQRGLHKLYDSVAIEPVPDELLKLIEQDRTDRAK